MRNSADLLTSIAAVAQAICTIVLVAVTSVYVWFTHRLSKAAQEQMRLMAEVFRYGQRDRVTSVAVPAAELMRIISSQDWGGGQFKPKDERRWHNAWTALERAGRSIGDPMVWDLVSDALTGRAGYERAWSIAKDLEYRERRELVDRIALPLARLASVYLTDDLDAMEHARLDRNAAERSTSSDDA